MPSASPHPISDLRTSCQFIEVGIYIGVLGVGWCGWFHKTSRRRNGKGRPKQWNLAKTKTNQLKACRGQIDKSEVELEVSSILGYLDVILCKIICSYLKNDWVMTVLNFLTSEVEVLEKSDVKIEAISSKRISRRTSILNIRFLALKMTELWQFEIKSVTYVRT